MKKLPSVTDKHLVRNLIKKIEGNRYSTAKLLRTLESQQFNAQLQKTADHLGMTRQEVLREVLGRD
jgi:hypothetical protein